MAKDGYVFHCSKCNVDHAGECEKPVSSDQLIPKWYIDWDENSFPGMPYYGIARSIATTPAPTTTPPIPASAPQTAPTQIVTWQNGTVTAVDYINGYVSIKLDSSDPSFWPLLVLGAKVKIDTVVD